MENSEDQRIGGRLRREVNLVVLTAMMIGINIGGSLFVLTGIAAGSTGPSLFIAQIISALPVLLALIPYMTLTSAIPATAANYQYAKLFSYPLAVGAGMVLLVAIPCGGLPLFAIGAGQSLQALIPGIPVIPAAIITMTLFYLINLIGIKPVGYVQLTMIVVLLLALITFIASGIPAIEADNLTPLFPEGAMGLIAASALLYTLLAGGLFGIEIGEEVKDAKSTIPKALIISMVIVTVIYLLIEMVAVGVIDWKIFAGKNLEIPARVFLSGPVLGFFIIGGGILACVTSINLTITAAGRYALAFAEDGFFPSFFANINKRFGTPHWGLTLPYFMSVIVLLINPPLETLGAMLNFGLIFIITLVLLTAFRLPKRHPEIYENAKFRVSPKILAITSLSAMSINIIFMILLAIALKGAFLIFLGAAIVGIILYFILRKVVPCPITH